MCSGNSHELRNGNTPTALFLKVADAMRNIKEEVEKTPENFSERSQKTVGNWTEEVK